MIPRPAKAAVWTIPLLRQTAAFQAAGISIRKALETDAAANLAALAADKLPELTHFHAGFHGISG